MSSRPVILAVAAGDESSRGYCLEQVAAAYDVVLLTGVEPTWEQPFIKDHEVVDLFDQDALLAGGRALAARHEVAGAVTWTEWFLVPVARLCEELGLPATPPEVMRACRNKATSRALFAGHEVPSAVSVAVATPAAAAAAAESIGYPVVVKPAAHAASIGVIRVDRPEELPAAYAFAAAGASQSTESGGVLIEEYLDGPEVSVECVTRGGHTIAVAVTRKTVGFPPYFEEVAHSVDASDPLLSTVAPVAAAAIEALGVRDGIQHVELRLVDGVPRLIEVNARIGGDLIGHLVQLATGVDLPRAAADLACGREPDLTPTRKQAAAIRMLYPAVSGTITARHFDKDFAARAPWLRQVVWQREIGEEVLLPPEGDTFTARAGFLIVTAHTAELAQQRAEEAYRRVTLCVEPRRQPVATG
ncbi:ATP-grasp domain-containing protein [Streptomyces sp. TP-A0874]|uniref:ATP-grasp domain-containing protein n=1 Tax=Streptomyces sp. TP-A0874 TaxID=549819 RepID=UPI000A67E610|nr:ATP-grasp domain-containing protein [Streptomyces sp. TP-A0874]